MQISSRHSQSPSLYVNCSSHSGLDSVNYVLVQITLLAGALITLTSILGGIDSANEGTRAWRAFRVLLWAAIVFDVGEAFICILAIKMCSELPLLATEKHVRLRDGSAISQSLGEAPRRGPQPPSRFRHRYLLLESVGMHPLYWLVDQLVIWVLVSASVLSFVTLFYWVVQTMTIVTAMLIVISFVIVIAMILTVFVISMGYGRNRY